MRLCSPREPVDAKEAYRVWAPAYDSTPNPLLLLEERTIAPLFGTAAGCDAVDLGCGTGRCLVHLSKVGTRSLAGVDCSGEMLEVASNKLGTAARLIQADCRDSSLPTASIDWVIASFLLSYVESVPELTRELRRITRPGATVLLSDVHPRARTYRWKRTFHHQGQEIEIATHPYEVSSLHAEMKAVGFDPIFLHELSFGEAERQIYVNAGRPDLYRDVDGLPVLLVVGYRRSNM